MALSSMQAEVIEPINPADHQGLVWMVVKRYLRVLVGTDCLQAEDLVQVGNMGLLRAMRDYDPEKGAFSTYATWWIRCFIRRELQDKLRTVRVPCHRQNSVEATRKLPKRNRPLYIKYKTKSPGTADVCVIDLMRDRFEPAISAEDTLLTEESRSGINMLAISELSNRERLVIRQRFWEDKTLQQIGDVLGLSRERVRQIQDKALGKLRRHVAND